MGLVLAEWMRALDGIQPVLVHSPPISSFSMSRTFFPLFASEMATVSPPDPAPMMRVW